ncbi:hypothetical protein F4778DRAFT_790868 [Xylariomycetidae sp. FL2044]|nr:hypothetical protein F4778DRAFT_790868 [Xylariomycetidae sp. FL2044]
MKPPSEILTAIVLFGLPVVSVPTTQLDKFMAWDSLIQPILRLNCSAEYAQFKSGYIPAGGLSNGINPVVNCILENFPEFRKAEMASSAVVLGLLPTMLSTVGNTPAEMGFLSLRRPLLAFLLAAGTPAASVTRASEFAESVKTLVEKGDERVLALRLLGGSSARQHKHLVSAAQLILVAAAVANVAYLAYQLGCHAVVAFVPQTIFMVPLWTAICVLIHLATVLILHLRLQLQPIPAAVEEKGSSTTPRKNVAAADRLRSWLHHELYPTEHLPAKKIEWRRDSGGLSDLLASILSLGTIINLIFGTMVFSSLLFFSVADSLAIAARYLASTLVCRAVLRMELVGLKDKMVYGPHEPEPAAVRIDESTQTTPYTGKAVLGSG